MSSTTRASLARVVRYSGEAAEVVIPDTLGGKPVKEIAATTFETATHVTAITIGESVTKIEDPSFKTLPLLQTLTVSENNVGYAVSDGVLFHKKMKTVYCYPQGKTGDSYTLPDTVTTVGANAFTNTHLTSLTMGDKITKVYASAFAGNKNLTSVKLSAKLSQLYESAFAGCEKLSDVTLPASMTSVGVNCFANCASLKSVSLPANTATLGAGAFMGCAALETIEVLGKAVQRIAEDTFNGCEKLTSVTFASEQMGIADRAFKGCAALSTIAITDKLTVIGSEAFMGCAALDGITLPAAITQIGARAFEGTAFLASQAGEWVIVGGGTLIAYLGADTAVTIPEGVKTISFLNTNIESVVIPEGVTAINDGAFADCAKLTGITFPTSLVSVGANAFKNCAGLTTVTIPLNLSSIGNGAFAGCANIENFLVETGNTTFMSDKGVLYNNMNKYLISYPAASAMTSYSVPYGAVRIAPGAVRGAKNLESFDTLAAEDLTVINEYAFADCLKLKSIKFHENFRTIGDYAFLNCSSLSDYEPNYMMTGIGEGAFQNCTSLTKLALNQPLAKIGNGVFDGNEQCQLTVYAGTLGEQYAKAHGLKFTVK